MRPPRKSDVWAFRYAVACWAILAAIVLGLWIRALVGGAA